ncbi:MAG: metal-dependent hydrolase family protein, partial [Candidatus Humimicrobiaceae bacterium]
MKKVIKAKKMLNFIGNKIVEIDNPKVYINKNKITRIEKLEDIELLKDKNIEFLDLQEYTIMPGLIDTHVHFYGGPEINIGIESDLYRMARSIRDAKNILFSGFTSVGCMGSNISPQLSRAIDDDIIPGPRIIASGNFIGTTFGTWDTLKGSSGKNVEMTVDGVDECRFIVRKRISQGAKIIKIGSSMGLIDDFNHAWGDSPNEDHQMMSITLEEVRTIVEEAHRFGLPVASHCIGDKGVKVAVEGGVDIIVHGHAMSDETRKAVLDKGIIVIPTLTNTFLMANAIYDPFKTIPPELKEVFIKHYEKMVDSFQKNLSIGIKMALGTDLNSDPWSPLGESAIEIDLYIKNGMSIEKAFECATINAAEALNLSNSTGKIEEGKLADIIGVIGDPLKKSNIFHDIKFVMKNGIVYVKDGKWINGINKRNLPDDLY